MARECGEYVKYVIEKCRCEECRRANREYENRRTRLKAYGGDYWPWVDAQRAREHVLSLMPGRLGHRDGIGPKQIAKVSGVPHGTISKLIYGDYTRGMPPSKKIHRETERKLLAVSREDAAPGSCVPAGPTWDLLECLISYGIPKYRIARALGAKSRFPGLQIARKLVAVKTARKVADLHWELWKRYADLRRHCTCVPPAEIAEYLEVSA